MANARFSTNGTVWSTVTINQTLDASGGTSFISSRLNSGTINSFAYVDGIWGAVTDNGVILRSMVDVNNFGTFNTIYNRQLISWTTVANPFSTVNTIAYGQGIWVVGGYSGRILTSTNLINWVTRTSNFGNTVVTKITYGQGIWVAAGKASLFAAGQVRSSTDAITWVTRTVNLTETGSMSHNLGPTYGNGTWVIAIDTGQVRSSTNAITWTTRNTVTNVNQWGSLSYANGIWFINSSGTELSGGALRTSTDLVTWTTRVLFTGNSENAYYPVLWNGTVYGTVLSNGGFRASTNAINWVTRVTPFNPDPASDVNITTSGIGYANGIWIITSAGTLTPRAMLTSTDTITWLTAYSSSFIKPESIIFDSLSNSMVTCNTSNFGNGVLVSNSSSTVFSSISKLINLNSSTFAIVSSGQLYTSGDLETFTQTTISWTTQSLNNILLSNGIYIYCFNGGQLQIDNAGSVSQITTGINDNFLSAAQKSGIYNIVGQNAIYRSTNLVNWTTISTPVPTQLDVNNTAVTWTTRTSTFVNDFSGTIESAAYGNGSWVLIGNNTEMRVSTDTITWTTRTISSWSNHDMNTVAYNNGIWVAGGGLFDYSILYSSTDTITWTTRFFGDPSRSAVQSLAYGNGLWLAVAGGQFYITENTNVMKSTNGISWSYALDSNLGGIRTVGYGNGQWIIAGGTGFASNGPNIRTSTDTITWVTQTSNFGNTNIRSIAYGNGIWVVVGEYGQLRTSTDVVNWVTRTSNFGINTITTVSYNDIWVAAGGGGEIRTSTDTINWVTRTSNFPAARAILTAAYGNNLWLVGGQYGQLRTAPRSISTLATDIIAI